MWPYVHVFSIICARLLESNSETSTVLTFSQIPCNAHGLCWPQEAWPRIHFPKADSPSTANINLRTEILSGDTLNLYPPPGPGFAVRIPLWTNAWRVFLVDHSGVLALRHTDRREKLPPEI